MYWITELLQVLKTDYLKVIMEMTSVVREGKFDYKND